MIRRSIPRALCALALATFACHAAPVDACTGVRLRAKDGSVVYGRTLEYGIDLGSKAIILPREFALQGTAADGRPGVAWKSRYAVVGMNGLGVSAIADGVNERGLAGGIFYLPGYAHYQNAVKDDDSRTLAPWELITWLLTRCATVDEARAAIKDVRVVAVPAPGLGIVVPVHYVLHDATGASLVIEYLKSGVQVYDNPIGVITNSPEFSWHLTNLENYIRLQGTNAPAITIDGVTLQGFGQGNGLAGLPGDYTSPSRFVRATALSHLALEGADGPEAIRQLFHVLDSFDIPPGAVVDATSGKPVRETTIWTTGNDLTNRVFYFHTRDNRRVRRIALADFDLNARHVLEFPAETSEDYLDVQPAPAR